MIRLFIALLFLPIVAMSQDTIDWKNFNNNRFNNILVKEISKVRTTNKNIKYDSTIQKAANIHGLYLSINNIDFLSFKKSSQGHMENFPLLSDFSSRVRFFNMEENSFSATTGGGEICAQFYNHKFVTYNQLVSELIKTYKESPEHWAILSTKGDIIGGSIHMSKKGHIYNVIVFYPRKKINTNTHNNIKSKILNGTMDSYYFDYMDKRYIDYDQDIGEFEDISRVSDDAKKYLNIISSWGSIYPDKTFKEKYDLIQKEYKSRIDKYNIIKKAF